VELASGPAPVEEAPRKRKVRLDEARAMVVRADARAVPILEGIVRADPTLAETHRLLGIAHARRGDAEKSRKEYIVYLLLRPDAPDADEVRAAIRGSGAN
jgi:Flp pilus assembly protein TadD